MLKVTVRPVTDFYVLDIDTDQQTQLHNWGTRLPHTDSTNARIQFTIYHPTPQDLLDVAKALNDAAVKMLLREPLACGG